MAFIERLYKKTKSISDLTYKVCNIAASIILAVTFFVILYAIIMRYFFLNPPRWSDELPRYLVIWMIFFAVSSAYHNGSHIGIEFIVRMLPQKLKFVTDIAMQIVLFLLSIAIIWLGFYLAFKFSSFQKSSSLGISLTYPMLSVPIGGLLLVPQIIHKLVTVIYKELNNQHFSS